MIIASASICLTDIPQDKITTAKNGKKYLNLSVFIKDEKDQYGNDVAITVNQSKEEREAKAKLTYLGNGKKVFEKQGEPQYKSEPRKTAADYINNKVKEEPKVEDFSSDLPF
jgi:hypothetical protein